MSFNQKRVPARLRLTGITPGMTTPAGRAGTAPNSPGITPQPSVARLAGAGACSGCAGPIASSQSSTGSPMRSPRACQYWQAVSPTQRTNQPFGLADRDEFASTMATMRDFCEQRRVAKQRADNELRLLQRELPLEKALSPTDLEQVSSLIERFIVLTVGALTRAVCKVQQPRAARRARPHALTCRAPAPRRRLSPSCRSCARARSRRW